MGAPVLIGAGIGAISSLAMGKDPLMGAAMGGLSGGAFGGAGGFGSGFTEGGLFNLGSGLTGTVATSTPTMGGLNLTGATTGAFDGALASSAATDGVIGSLPYQANTPSLLTNSANSANIYNIPETYTGLESAMQNPAINGSPVQTYGLKKT